jgi:hypothetical protein
MVFACITHHTQKIFEDVVEETCHYNVQFHHLECFTEQKKPTESGSILVIG